MVDKIWYDWQKKHPENFWSYLGGTVPAHSQPGLYAQFPTGGPPFMNVSENLVLIASHPPYVFADRIRLSSPQKCPRMES